MDANVAVKKSPITTHVLNLESGKPAGGMLIRLFNEDSARSICDAITDEDGRIVNWGVDFHLTKGTWKVVFCTKDWYRKNNIDAFYPRVTIEFVVSDVDQHFHIPLLVNQFGYSTYRGS